MFESCDFHKKLVTLQPICKRCKMKTIKWLGICLLALLVSGGLSSCGDDEYSSRLRELILKKEMTFMANEMKGDLSYTTTFRNEDLSNYSAQSDASWCHVTIDVEKSQMTVTVDENQNRFFRFRFALSAFVTAVLIVLKLVLMADTSKSNSSTMWATVRFVARRTGFNVL